MVRSRSMPEMNISPGLSAEDIARIGAPARDAVASGDIPGVVCLVWRGGKLLQLEAVGLRNIEARLPVERSTIFRIASMSKPLTTAVALQLVERGAMRLQDPITKWAPEFADMRVLCHSDGSLEDTYPAPRSITVEDLLTHRSGPVVWVHRKRSARSGTAGQIWFQDGSVAFRR